MLGWLLLALQAGAAPSQDPGWQELRFHRIHLRNGNFIDGQLVRETGTEVHLKLKAGQMAVRRDLIERVEFVKMRQINEKAPEVALKPPSDPIGPRTTPSTGNTPPRKTRGTAASAAVAAEVKAKAEALFERLRRGSNEQKAEVGKELKDLGEGVAVYAADVLDTLDDDSIKVIGPMLVELKSADVIKIIQSKVQHSRAIVRAHCAVILGACGESAEDVRPLLPLGNDAHPEVALAALTAMGKHGLGDAFPAALRQCSSKDSTLRKGALGVLVQIAKAAEREADLEPAFKDLVDSSSGEALLDVLTQVGSANLKGLAPQAASFLGSEDAGIRAKAAELVGSLGDRTQGDAVLDRLDLEKDKWTRVFLAQASLKLRITRSVDPLIEWLDDEDDDVRLAALDTLKKLTGVNPGLTKEVWAEWRSKSQ